MDNEFELTNPIVDDDILEYLDLGTGVHITFRVDKENVKIYDSYLYKDVKTKITFISFIRSWDPTAFGNRSDKSLLNEWQAHNIVYRWGLFKNRTKDTDLNKNEYLHRRILYWFVSHIFREK